METITNGNQLPSPWMMCFACASKEAAETIAARYPDADAYYLEQSRGGHLYIVTERESESEE